MSAVLRVGYLAKKGGLFSPMKMEKSRFPLNQGGGLFRLIFTVYFQIVWNFQTNVLKCSGVVLLVLVVAHVPWTSNY